MTRDGSLRSKMLLPTWSCIWGEHEECQGVEGRNSTGVCACECHDFCVCTCHETASHLVSRNAPNGVPMTDLEQRIADALTTLDHLRSDVDRWEQQEDVSAFAAADLRSYLRVLVSTLEGNGS